MIPQLITFDIFGTVVDWRRGMVEAVRAAGLELTADDFDRVTDLQGEIEQGEYEPYAEIVAESLVKGIGLDAEKARMIGARAGDWPLFADSRDALARLMRVAPVIAMTNSDRIHGEQVRAHLGFRLSDWICAEDVRCYKPARAFWDFAAKKAGVPFGDHWWHVSAYADYDLGAARSLGLNCVLVARPHGREDAAATNLRLGNLEELADRVDAGALA
jgi:2-haloalkanoic acid dehalogenase type II